ncbi:MAG: MoaD/ThiS family protein [Planctomycetaceae bacterium]
MPTVFIPPSLRRHTDGVDRIQMSETTVREIIATLEEQFPGIRQRLCDGDHLRPGLAVAIDSRISDLGLLEQVGDAKEVHFVAAVGGG